MPHKIYLLSRMTEPFHLLSSVPRLLEFYETLHVAIVTAWHFYRCHQRYLLYSCPYPLPFFRVFSLSLSLFLIFSFSLHNYLSPGTLDYEKDPGNLSESLLWTFLKDYCIHCFIKYLIFLAKYSVTRVKLLTLSFNKSATVNIHVS